MSPDPAGLPVAEVPVQFAVESIGLAKAAGQATEDAVAYDTGRGRIAVSDGASRAFGAAEWAGCLVRHFVTDPPPDFNEETLAGWVAPAVAAWHQDVGVAADAPPHIRAAAARGSFATLVGLVTIPSSPWANTIWWRAMSVGDSCLFMLRQGTFMFALPSDDLSAFGARPPLLSTLGDRTADALRSLRTTAGSCGPGDDLLFMTDAMARWALTVTARDGTIWRFLANAPADEIREAVRTAKARKDMEEDDVTLVRCRAVAAPDRPAAAPQERSPDVPQPQPQPQPRQSSARDRQAGDQLAWGAGVLRRALTVLGQPGRHRPD